MRRALAALLIVGAGCGGGTDGTPAAPPTAPAPAPPPEPAPPPPPPIEITPVDRGISVTDRGQILVELTPGDIVPANPLDLAGRTLVFTPDGRGGYSRSVRALAWEEDLGDRVDDRTEIEPSFPFDFAGQRWESFFVSRYGVVTFGEPYPFPQNGPDRWGTMQEIAVNLGAPPADRRALQAPARRTVHPERRGVGERPARLPAGGPGPHHLDHHGRQFPLYGVPPQEKTRSNWPSMPMAASRSTTRRKQTIPTKRSATASWACFRAPRPACSAASPTRWMGRFPATWTWWKPHLHDCRSGSRAGRVHDARTHPGDPGPDTVL